ncbi:MULTISPECIES: MBL fold metallo-hydrolase [Nocardia]|uniref:MBL fold metallo-hydrolase n=1 Tax=Nocardia TaxID=1817 RepID=UPI0006FBBC20|nr:MBL fold metallo-hydrolase [Nocardia sp. Root136]KQY37073.1 MBL fold metallo-hydrolase [Nocardia sp. Root136]
MGVRITHIGGPTVLIEIDGWNILTDPTFDDPGQRYDFALGTSSVKTIGPAIRVTDLPAIDVVLLSHDHHADNLDHRGRALLHTVPRVITTSSGSRRLGLAHAEAMVPWQETVLRAPGRASLRVTATPSRHGPPLSRVLVGENLGFAIQRPSQAQVAVWMSGDSVYFRGLEQVARRLDVDIALLHIGAVRFGLTGPVKYTMDARDAARFIRLLGPRIALPVHYEGWSHFSESHDRARVRLLEESEGVHHRVQWLPLGQAVEFPSPTGPLAH